MRIRILVAVLSLIGVICSVTIIGGRAGAQVQPVLTIDQRLTNQRVLINQLEARMAALEGRGAAAGSAGAKLAPPRFVRPKASVADMAPGLAQMQTQHAQFVRATGATAPSGPDVSAQVASLTKEVASLKSELSVDETIIFGELQLVRTNVNTIDDDTTSTYGDAVEAAWLACTAYGHQQVRFAGWTTLYGGTPAPCFN